MPVLTVYSPAGSFLPPATKSNGMFALRVSLKPANPAIDRAAMTLSVTTMFRICFFIVSSIRFLRQQRFRFAACVYRLRKASFVSPSVDCLLLRIRQASRQRPRANPSLMEVRPNYLQVDGLFLGGLSWEYHRAVSARAVTLSNRIVRLSAPLLFSATVTLYIRPTMYPGLGDRYGPMKGQFISLSGETPIWLGSSNHIAVSDPSLSRRHCLITGAEAGFTLTDLGSSNGAYVNGVPVHERLLEHGDQLTLGDSVFLFLLREGEPPSPAGRLRLSDDELLKGLTVRLRREEAVYLDASKIEAALPRETRCARDLNTLLKISAAINATRNLAALAGRLLELIGEAVPAETGALLLLD